MRDQIERYLEAGDVPVDEGAQALSVGLTAARYFVKGNR
jgi:hypothetical protein